MEALLERQGLTFTRVNVLALGPDAGCLVLVWGSVAQPGEGALSSVPDLERAAPVGNGKTCPKCKSPHLLGLDDSDGDVTCARCGHAWHDPSLVDDT